MKQRVLLILSLLLMFSGTAWTGPGDLVPPQTPGGQSASLNPLTGLPVEDPKSLLLPPALVSITNFPLSARPQAGLSYSPIVFEMFTGEGDSRLLALFYGDYPKAAEELNSKQIAPVVGPIRSGRLPYEHIRKLYNGFLVMASAYKSVAATLSQFTNIYGSDEGNINSALIDVTKLEKIAESSQKLLKNADLGVTLFDPQAPSGGKTANTLWLPYSYMNQIFWRYDAESGAYLRYHDNADGVTFSLQTDRLNGESLAYENVVILFANHHAYHRNLIDVDLMYIDKMPALLLRDGRLYEIFWTTKNGEYEKETGKTRPIRFIDAEGNPFPFKPGQTWVQIVPTYTPYEEVVDSTVYFDLKHKLQPGSGVWAVRFCAPEIEPAS